MDEMIVAVNKFMAAQDKAEKNGFKAFTCPLCSGDAWWVRSTYNNHLHCGCRKCGFKMME